MEVDKSTDTGPIGQEIKDDKSEIHNTVIDSLISGSPSSKTPPCILTGRGVTLTILIAEGIIEPGNKALSIDYLGRSFIADLLPNGRIKTPATGEEFATPSAWAMHCKQVVNPAKKSGCGWASVKYRGRKLDYYKNQWFRRQTLNRTMSPAVSENTNTSDTENSCEETDKMADAKNNTHDSHSSTTCSTPVPNDNKKKDWPNTDIQEEALNLCLHDDVKPAIVTEKTDKKADAKCSSRQKCVQYGSLGKRSAQHDMSTQVETLSFTSVGKTQPFTASVTSNCLLIIDFHSHLSHSEVCGYLAGRFEPTSQHLSILQAFPCKCRMDDKENAAVVEDEIKQKMRSRGLWLVGWYHTHPRFSPHPTLRDIDTQMEHQYRLTSNDNSYSPCFALIVSPYEADSTTKEASSQAFWVFPPPEHRCSDYAMPMKVTYAVHHDTFLTQDVLTEMKDLVDFYSSCHDLVKFEDCWDRSWTYLDKVKSSLAKKLPKTQSESGGVLQIVHSLLTR